MYGQTWDDLATTPPERAWQMLRSLRHDPPGAAQEGERKVVFGAALEQAEQLFTAARTVTPATSPLLLFYGLSQAGRAVAAAAVGEENAVQWQLRGHGITNEHPSGLKPATFSSLKVKNSGRGAFTQISDILKAASLPSGVPLGDLWCLLPESTGFPLPGMGIARPISIGFAGTNRAPDQPDFVATVPIPRRVLNLTDVGLDPSGVGVDWERKQAAVRDYLAQFPSLTGRWDFPNGDGQPISVSSYSPTDTQINIRLRKPTFLWQEEALLRLTTRYRSAYLAFPVIGDDSRPAHPFLLWWAVLFTLSKYARYEPSTWASLTSINSSSAAAAIEHLLRESMIVLPELIHRTIYEVA
jgi:hypothetical protein